MSWAESSTHFVATAFRDAEMIRLRQRNETLRRAMESQGIRFADLAAATGKNVKTAQRWVYEGRTPRFAARERIAQVLDADAMQLWPDQRRDGWTPDLVRLYPRLTDVPRGLWLRLARQSIERVDVTVTDEPLPTDLLAEILAERVQAGVEVRICLSGKAQNPGIGGAHVRHSATAHTTPVHRFDRAMLVWMRCAAPGLDRVGPVLRLTRSVDNGIFDTYAQIFESIWDSAPRLSTPPAD